MNKDCIFCKIIKKKIPCNLVYENKKFLVFLDIKPVNLGHLLIIPKKHIVWMQESDDKTISEIFKLAKKMMRALKKGLGCDYVVVSVVGNEVPHFHIHLIPKFLKDKSPQHPRIEYKNNSEIKKISSKIKNVL